LLTLEELEPWLRVAQDTINSNAAKRNGFIMGITVSEGAYFPPTKGSIYILRIWPAVNPGFKAVL
jgi:hypothetical protein